MLKAPSRSVTDDPTIALPFLACTSNALIARLPGPVSVPRIDNAACARISALALPPAASSTRIDFDAQPCVACSASA